MVPAALLVTVLAGGGFAALETDSVESYWEGLWWALSLVTTVGFVGEAPTTVGGRILSSVLMVVGFALLTMTTAAVASLFVLEDELPEEQRDREFEREVLEELREMKHRLTALERRPTSPPDDA
jgi:voltage-gated potassium channel